MRITKISNMYGVTIKFTVPMNFPDDFATIIGESPRCYLDLRLISIDRMQVDKNLLDWQIKSVSSKEISIFLKFA